MAAPRLSRLLPDPLDALEAPASLRDILDTARGAVEPPIRSEIFGAQRFAQHGRSLGVTHRAQRLRSHAATFFPRLRSNIHTLREAHRYIGEQARTGYDISPAAEWLLDNFHLIEAQLEQVHEGLPRSYFRALPVLQDEPLAGLPRIYGVAWAFVAHTDGAFDEDLLAHFLIAYQETRELRLSEMWALPTTLRVVLIENLRRLAERVATNKAAREVANLCCDRIESYDLDALDALLARLNQRGVGRVFLAQMARRLHDRGGPAQEGASHGAEGHDVKSWLARALPDAAAAQRQHSADQAADNLSVSNAVTSLRVIGDADWPDIVARTSTLMRLMLTSPVFEAEHAATRDQTLHGIELLAERSGRSEGAVAQTLLDLMHGAQDRAADASAAQWLAHPEDLSESQVAGHWLRGAGRAALLQALGLHEPLTRAWLGSAGLRSADAGWGLLRRLGLWVYLGSMALGTLGLIAWLLLPHAAGLVPGSRGAGWLALAALLMLFPASEAVVAVINRLISESAQPQHLPRLAFAQGIPAAHRVLVVIPALLTDTASIEALAHRLQLHHLANTEAQAQFALLTDWADADTEQRDSDEPLLASALAQVAALNLRHPAAPGEAPRFIVLHRRRSGSATERRWIGWERKRGKLEQLIGAIVEGRGEAFIDLGDASRLASGAQYVLTLDSDTHLPPGRLRELVGVAAHPHNQPRLDASGRRVTSGYAILQPRIVTPLPQPHEMTRYHALFAGQCGIDPYSAATSEVYQDLFGEGSYTGKGLLHVRAMHAVLGGRLPEGQVLSHDLLEGCIARCAAVTDITLIEDAPFHADVAASRVHRWTRGDWQLLPFLLNPVRWPLRTVHRWKMFDNLRRSVVAPMSLGLLLLALATQVVSPWAMLALVFAAFSAGPVMGAVAGFSPSRDDLAKLHFYRQAGIDFARALCGGLWLVAQLVQQALLAGDAVLRALYRLMVSRRHLLQWTTAAAAQASARTELSASWRKHWGASAVSLGLLVLLLAAGTATPKLAIGLGLLWALSPVWTWWVSRPLVPLGEGMPGDPQAATDAVVLEGVARDTWRYFERVVGPDDHHLPPDNLQTAPHDMLAHRTSPTNIGLYLLSVACARRFGWIATQELIARLEATLASLHRLPRHRGHFLNWYDTQTLAPLLPMYVSTVDSGNLSGHLLAVGQACLELAHAPHDGAASDRAIAASRVRLTTLWRDRAGRKTAARDELRWLVADHRAMLRSARRDSPHEGASDADARERLQALAQAFEQLAWEADYAFLYHRKRHLFHIGYRVAEQQLDTSFYDLLASESRLTSLLAIAKGDAPVRHWASLGRPFFAVGADAGLRSWSGSMFEYLMPSLVLIEPQGSVLREAGHAAVREQIAFTREQGLPWGISESAYAGSDHTLAYQYAPQGVPRLALRRTPPDELVIAPYATVLATLSMPRESCANLAALQALGARARYGFIEALDFTPARQGGDEAFTPVHTFMAHHQGMSIVAIANVLLDGVAQRWGMAHPRIEAVASLLHERTPREVLALHAPPSGAPQQALARRTPGLQRQVLPGAGAIEPTHLLSNGRYSVALRANGAGWSRWGASGITRTRDDALRDAYGSFFYLRREPDAQAASPLVSPLISITQHPAPDPEAHYQSTYHADRVCFDALWPDLQAHTTVWVSPEDDIEFRRVELRNHSDRTIELELISAFDVVLADPRADEAHPAFSNLFVRAEWQAASQALVFARLPRLATERGLNAAHFLTGSDAQVIGLRVQTDRQRWLGRNGSAARPLASFDALPVAAAAAPADALGNEAPPVVLGTGLDPVCALAVRVRIAARGKLQLSFATAASDDAGTLQAVIDKYRQPSHVQRASLMSATLTGIRVRTSRVSPESFAAIQTLTTALVLSLSRVGAKALQPAVDVCDRRLLWRFGISGDRPIVLVFAGATQGLGLLRSLAQALRLWAFSGVTCDLVVVNAEPSSYLMPVHHDIAALRERHAAETAADGVGQRTGLHLLRADELSNDELATLQHLARVRLQADGRPLAHHVQDWSELHEQALLARQEGSVAAVTLAPARARAPAVTRGIFGGPSAEFRFDVNTAQRPERPWINVLANPGFGAQITEAGGGYTWAQNSRLNQLTPWSNDPVADPPGEQFLLQDRKTLQVWSVAPSASGDAQATYRIAHGQGYTVISHRQGELEVTALWCVDAQASVKQVSLRLVNRGHRTRSLRAIGIAEWVMGGQRSDRATTRTAVHRQRWPAARDGEPTRAPLTTLLCSQLERAAGFGGGTAFLALAAGAEALDEADDWTCDRRECFDARGQCVVPDQFGQRAGLGLDPCAALSTTFSVAPGESVECVFLLGHAPDVQAAIQLAASAATVAAAQRVEQVRSRWDGWLGAATVKTPDPLFDAMVNRWLLYQAISCRLWAKAGFYQAGGATGFRDQLQDAMALAWAAPAMLRAQIVLCASRQFPQGDVQHWWHAPGGAGVRTHFSDDLLWLPYALAHYLRSSGDAAVLDEAVPFLDGIAVAEGAEDAYYEPRIAAEMASVYEHAARSIDRSLRVGTHGLPLMGTGDWNDGMNRVGHEGRGESVWLAWFLCKVVAEFAPIARARDDTARAERWEQAAQGWREALKTEAWDGAWFKRAFFDDGSPLGSGAGDEARIDLIAQAWAVLSGAADAAQQAQALAAMDALLVDREAGLIRLLDPPLAHAQPSAGYIQAYPPGVRENGGQYSHAGVWALMAQAQGHRSAAGSGSRDGSRDAFDAAPGDAAYRYFTYLSPAHRAAHPVHGPAYAIEPYVMAGDVYSQPPYVGRGGWSWYTGAAAWLHRAAIESIFGLELTADTLRLRPCLPSHWPHAELTLRRDGRSLRLVFVRALPAHALRAAEPWCGEAQAVVLPAGEWLRWRELPVSACVVVAWLDAAHEGHAGPEPAPLRGATHPALG